MVNLNFSKERDGEYPDDYVEILNATDEEIIDWINTLPAPETDREVEMFNEIFNQFHLRGGKV